MVSGWWVVVAFLAGSSAGMLLTALMTIAGPQGDSPEPAIGDPRVASDGHR
jgi:hypothetical protein